MGKPAHGVTAELFGEDGRPGASEGELVLGGEQLAPGYWRRPGLTAAAFTPADGGRRLYHTGDVGRLLPDGNIEYVGRKDFRIKVQGSRVELGEVEAALSRVAG